jgi:N-acetylmuramic acid 6-phosphate etherase
MHTILGVDGGATRTDAVLSDQEGRILGLGEGGPSNYNVVGLEAATSALNQAIESALTDAHQEAPTVKAAVLGVAFRDEPNPFSAWFARRLPNAKTMVVPDYELALPAGTPDGWGIAVICGTGSVAYGRDPEGHKAITGGWGYLIGDEGSGYAIGLAALRALTRAIDGRGPKTQLMDLILKEWKLEKPNDVAPRVYQEGTTHADIAALTPLVETAARAGDSVAISLLTEAGHELAIAVAALVQKLQWPETIPCAQAGSVILNSQFMANAFLEWIEKFKIPLDPIEQVSEPVHGALRLARGLTED